MKKLLAFMLSVIMLLSFSGCGIRGYDSEEAKKAGKLVVGVTEFEPMNYKENGEWTGFDTEFAKMFAKEKLGVEVEFVEIVWDDKYELLNDYTIDCIWNGYTVSQDVEVDASISKAYLRNSQVLVTKADRIANYKDGYDVKDLTFVVEKGSAAEQCLERSRYKNVTKVKTQIDALDLVNKGEIDAAVVDITLAKAIIGEGKQFPLLATGFEYSTEVYAVAFRTGSDLTDMLNEYISEIWDEKLHDLADKYDLTLV